MKKDGPRNLAIREFRWYDELNKPESCAYPVFYLQDNSEK
jgi:hypothetical protein